MVAPRHDRADQVPPGRGRDPDALGHEAAREAGEGRVILFGLCGHGNFDLAAYDAYLSGSLEDPEFGEDELRAALDALPEGAPSLA